VREAAAVHASWCVKGALDSMALPGKPLMPGTPPELAEIFIVGDRPWARRNRTRS
jgi:hypothetical protein